MALAIVAAKHVALAQDAAPNTDQMIEPLQPLTRNLRNFVVDEAARRRGGECAGGRRRQRPPG